MKNRSYANRGSAFEQYIEYANRRYRRDGLAFIQKVPTEFKPIRNARGQVCSVKVEHKATFDYIGRYKQYPIAIEAKNTNTDSIRFDRVEWNQAEDMDDFTSQPGTIGIVLVSFNLEHFYAIPWAFWSTAYRIRVNQNDRTSTIKISAFDQTWEVPKKYSVRQEELLPEWEVQSGPHGLEYLATIERYITGGKE